MRMKKKFFMGIAFAFLTSAANAQTSDFRTLGENFSEVQKQKVELLSNENADEAFAKLSFSYQIYQKDIDKLKQILKNREVFKAQASLKYEDVSERVKVKMTIDEAYKDSIYTFLIPYNCISGENLGFLLNLCTRGLCKPEQQQKLMKAALEIAHKLEKYPGLNVWNEEMDIIQNTLDNKQMDIFLGLKNLEKNNQDYRYAWKQLVDAGLTEQVDSVTDGNQLFMYIAAENKINSLYKYKEDFRVKNLKELRKHQPYIVHLLTGLSLKKEAEEKQVGGEFVW